MIDRCSKAVENHDGLEPMDVDVLKLLYLIRYVNEDIPANLDNLVILMADDIRLEKVAMREKLRGSLDRLIGQNYIGRTGDTYNFLTDEEQDIQKEINLTPVSYTHLDVYKRQPLTRTICGWWHRPSEISRCWKLSIRS